MKVATWNINSLRLRLALLDRLVAALDPDVICLQETKVPDALVLDAGPAALGYPFVVRRGSASPEPDQCPAMMIRADGEA